MKFGVNIYHFSSLDLLFILTLSSAITELSFEVLMIVNMEVAVLQVVAPFNVKISLCNVAGNHLCNELFCRTLN